MAGLKTLFRGIFDKSAKKVESQTEVQSTSTDIEALAVASGQEVRSKVNRLWVASGFFSCGWITDVGRVRGHNEDALYVFSGEQEADNGVSPFGLFVLADGMGGHQSGEIASSLALKVSAHQLISQVYLPLLAGMDRGSDQPSLTDVVREAVTRANRAVTQGFPGSGCTLTSAMILGDRLFIGHVGDSRAYLLRENQHPNQLTKDHSLVSRLQEMGQLTAEEAAVHPQRNVLYRAIGQGGALEVDVLTYALEPGDRLLLCSDGLWGAIDDDRLWRIIQESSTPQEACGRLVEAANAAGGHDNITVVLVEVWRDPITKDA
jgi:serine/threonine protein phosphatase PrpC